ncbi:uncharacterized protein LOC144037515 [Vanacampus margaritifer]
MGKPLSRPDCLQQSPRCLGKGDEDEAYIEDCYVPQRSIYDTMRINEQIDQGAKLCQPSRSTLGSGGEIRGEGSTLSSNGTIGADLGGVFVSRAVENPGGARKLDERVIFDALKLTGDAQIISPPVGILSSGLTNPPSVSASGVSLVAKRRHQAGERRDNPNRRSWKAFMPPTFPEFAERLEFASVECAEKRSSAAGLPHVPLSPVQLAQPSTPTSSTLLPTILPYTPSPSSSAPHTPPVSSSPTVFPVPTLLQHPSKPKQLRPLLHKQAKQRDPLSSPSKDPGLTFSQSHRTCEQSCQQSPPKNAGYKRTISSSRSRIKQIAEETVELVKTSDSERDSPLLEQDQGDDMPLLPPRPVFCPPTKARTWPRGMTPGKKTPVSLRHNFPILPPLPPLLGEESSQDEESLYLLDPPSPFLKEDEGLAYRGLPLSPSISQLGGDESLLGWGGNLRERTASELKFEEDERRILEELEVEEEQSDVEMLETREDIWNLERAQAEEERAEREEREWEAVLKLDNREVIDQPWETLESEGWELTGSSGQWPVLTPPVGFGSTEAPGVSSCPSSEAESDDLFLELERRCEEEEEGHEGVEMSVDPEPLDPYSRPYLEDEQDEESVRDWESCEGTLPLTETPSAESHLIDFEDFGSKRAQDCEKEHCFIDDDEDVVHCDYEVGEEERSFPTDSALGYQQESDSSGMYTFQPDKTADCVKEIPAEAETDPDSGASSQGDAPSPQIPVNPFASEEPEHGMELKEDMFEADLDLFDQSSLDSSEGGLGDHSHEPLHTRENTKGSKQDVDGQISYQDALVPFEESDGMFFEADVSGQDVDLETTIEVKASTPKSASVHPPSPPLTDPSSSLPQSHFESDSFPPSEVTHSSPVSSLSQCLVKSDYCAAASHSKDSEAFVISDSFVYLAVSAPPQLLNECSPSPLENSNSPSPVPEPPCCSGQDEDEEGPVLSPDSFVYMAAPERPKPGPSDVSSACEDIQDLDSYSEGTQSGMDGVEFVLGSVTGEDSDWESEDSALDFPAFVSKDPVWDQLEPGLLQGLFSQPETSTVEDESLRGSPVSPTGTTSTSSESSASDGGSVQEFSDTETQDESPCLLRSLGLNATKRLRAR